MSMNLIYFIDIIDRINDKRDLEQERLKYINKRRNGDHTWSTLAKIKILTTRLMEIELN